MSTHSAYLDRVRDELWAKPVFTFIPDRDLPPATGTVHGTAGPRVVFAGFPSDFSLAFLLALLTLDVTLVGIVTSPGAHPAILGDNALSRIAEHVEAPLIRAWRINDEHTRFALAELRVDAVVMASFDQIVGVRALELARHGWLNVHPSLLPAYRGPEPVYWAIADGAAETGITLHRAVAKFDAGAILAQVPVPITPTDTAGTLTKRLVTAGVGLVPVAVARLVDDDPGDPMDIRNGSYRSSVGHRSLVDAATAVEAERLIRAGVPNMLPWAEVNGDRMYVTSARVVPHGADPSLPVIHYPDADLVISGAGRTCGCHHDTADCPHRVLASFTVP